MVRTAGSDGTRTEAAIRDAAIELIAAHGFEAVTLRALARHVGIQAGSLYRYYPSKDDLLLRIVTLHLEDLLAQWGKVEPAGATAAERLAAFVAFHVHYHAEKPREVLIANMEIRSLRPEDRPGVIALRKTYEDILHRIVDDGIAEGAFAVADGLVTTFAILAMLTGLTSWYREGGRLSRQQLVDCYIQLVMSGVSGKP